MFGMLVGADCRTFPCSNGKALILQLKYLPYVQILGPTTHFAFYHQSSALLAHPLLPFL